MGKGTPKFKLKYHHGKQHLSTAEEKQRSHPACKLTGGKATADTLQGYLQHRVRHVQALPTGLDSQVHVSAHRCIPVMLLGLEELEV